MIPTVSGAPPAAAVSRSVEALNAMLEAAESQAMDLANRLLRAQAQGVIQDTSLGSRIDAYA